MVSLTPLLSRRYLYNSRSSSQHASLHNCLGFSRLSYRNNAQPAPVFRVLIIALLSFMMLLMSLPAQAAGLDASVDRNRLSENESITLFIRAPGLQLNGEPELAELYQDFEVLAQQVRTNIQIINGVNQSERVWEISLLPKRTGTLIIPSIQLGDASSQPITLEVQPAPANTKDTADVFLHSEIDATGSIYVQQQLIYTLRLYYATSISDHGLTDLDLDKVVMVQLGNRKDFEARIDGRLYNVAEWQFALYPQSSGELVIPPQTFSGRVRIQNRYSLGGLKQIRIQSPEHRIQVRPIPDTFPANAQWLPARSVELTQQWSGNYAQWQEGVPLTRKLTLRAQGLTAAQLSPILMPQQEGLRQYPEQPQLNDLPENLNQEGAGITGEKEISVALIPTRSGTLELPAVRVPWWNTRTDRLEMAELDPLALEISPDPNRVVQPTVTTDNGTGITPPLVVPQNNHRIWQISTLILTLICGLLAWFWWQAKQRLTTAQQQLWRGSNGPALITTPPRTENPIFRQALLNACQQNQARAAWDAWQKWQHHEAPETTPEFQAALLQLQQSLFGPQSTDDSSRENWSGKELAQASQNIGLPKQAAEELLPALYPR